MCECANAFAKALAHSYVQVFVRTHVRTSVVVHHDGNCEEVGVVKRIHLLSGEVRRVATALKVVEEVQEEVQEVTDE